MATQVIAKYKGNEVKGEVLSGEGKPRLKVLSWTLDNDKPAPKDAAKGFVGETFDSVNKAGHEGMGAIRKYLKLSPLPNNYIVFFENGSARPYATRDFGGKVNGSKPVAKVKAAPKAEAPKVKATRKGSKSGPVTTRKATATEKKVGLQPKVAAKASPKSSKAAKAASAKNSAPVTRKSGRPKAAEPEELDI